MRLLSVKSELKKDKSLPTFGYTSNVFSSSTKGVICVIGSDHGGGSSKYIIKTLYLSSSEQREKQSIDYRMQTIQFAEVLCRKDVHHIQTKITPVVNKGVHILENSQLIGIQLPDDKVASM